MNTASVSNLNSANNTVHPVMHALNGKHHNPNPLNIPAPIIKPVRKPQASSRLVNEMDVQKKQIHAMNGRNQTLQALNQSLQQGNRNYLKQLQQLRHNEQQYKQQLQKQQKAIKSTQQRYSVLEKKCKQHVETLLTQNLRMDSTSDELCSTSRSLNNSQVQAGHEQLQYDKLLEQYNELQAKHESNLNNSWFINRIDGVHEAVIGAKQAMAELSAKLKPQAVDTVDEEIHDEELEKEEPAIWLNANKFQPDATGMYQVSNGKQSALAYFNTDTGAFQPTGFSIRFWLKRAESAGINAINNGFAA